MNGGWKPTRQPVMSTEGGEKEGEKEQEKGDVWIGSGNLNRSPQEATETVGGARSRKEREEVEKHRLKERYQRMYAEGKTEQARADMARLALVRRQREEAIRRREEEQKAKEERRNEKKKEQARTR
eukprot:TRINITY_DN8364_c0_g1_i3.p1 TRINITY_DN8364_c0_g1~~TRINITY_DN8364_c0_g1_i3.p1  ORF type:complete len:138 (-),score=52.28 TRINITY_DN8364_c0_g1_i3:22-399(-)